ncbi:ribonuclease T2 [Rhodovulum sp. PH10]|uniref:ribonuclease T2 family protein n=1 Tax=Rhodovulum sp. PH10 TaxID=1187851 RepID=UPI00027C2C7E|nr:ribonuclease T2 [Rhodovulum sp. PH10]EJW10606.1 ribonuclease T2 [Rhodovulum sp. PH10]
MFFERGGIFERAGTLLALCLLLVPVLVGAPAAAQDRRQNTPGAFDFYVLALSWSPSWCAGAAERPKRKRPDPQCGERPYAFVVHGLWPQYERGFPEYCQVPAPRLDRSLVSSMLDLMPSPRLVFHEWNRHGVCSGLPPRGYFEAVRKARAVVKIPEAFIEPETTLTVAPDEVEAAFVAANPGLERTGIAVGCSRNRLSEVRICLGRDFGFRPCPEVDRRSCRRKQLAMPPVRGADLSPTDPSAPRRPATAPTPTTLPAAPPPVTGPTTAPAAAMPVPPAAPASATPAAPQPPATATTSQPDPPTPPATAQPSAAPTPPSPAEPDPASAPDPADDGRADEGQEED